MPGILAMVFQQFSGINAVMFYLNHFLMVANISWYNMAGSLTMALQVCGSAENTPARRPVCAH